MPHDNFVFYLIYIEINALLYSILSFVLYLYLIYIY